MSPRSAGPSAAAASSVPAIRGFVAVITFVSMVTVVLLFFLDFLSWRNYVPNLSRMAFASSLTLLRWLVRYWSSDFTRAAALDALPVPAYSGIHHHSSSSCRDRPQSGQTSRHPDTV